jgi:hypothetical protein
LSVLDKSVHISLDVEITGFDFVELVGNGLSLAPSVYPKQSIQSILLEFAVVIRHSLHLLILGIASSASLVIDGFTFIKIVTWFN